MKTENYQFGIGLAFSILIIIAACIALSGCATGGTTVSREQATQFKVGVTTEPEVEHVLGAPQMVQDMPDGTKLVIYSGNAIRMKAATFIPIVGLFAGGAKVQQSTVSFRFGADGKLVSTGVGHYNAESHAGL